MLGIFVLLLRADAGHRRHAVAMTALFFLYLVMADKPRFDDTNVVAEGLTMEKCEEASGALNGEHHAMHPEGQPRYLWICGPMPPPVEHEDIRGV